MSLNTVIKIVFAVGSAAMASGLIKKVKEDAKNLKPDVVSNTILTPTTSVAATVDTQSKKEKQHTNTPFLVLGAIVIVAGLAFAYQKNSRLQQAIAREKQITSERASVAREQARLREQRQREFVSEVGTMY